MAPEGVDPALSSNAHRHRELAELLQGPRTMAEFAGDLRHQRERRRAHLGYRTHLRHAGVQVVTLNVGDQDPLYRVLHRRGRVCAAEGCTTILRRSNPADTCALHGGGCLTVAQMVPARPEPSRVDWRGLRELWGLSQAEWARRAKVNAGFLLPIERGLQRPSQDVARRLFDALPMRR